MCQSIVNNEWLCYFPHYESCPCISKNLVLHHHCTIFYSFSRHQKLSLPTFFFFRVSAFWYWFKEEVGGLIRNYSGISIYCKFWSLPGYNKLTVIISCSTIFPNYKLSWEMFCTNCSGMFMFNIIPNM